VFYKALAAGRRGSNEADTKRLLRGDAGKSDPKRADLYRREKKQVALLGRKDVWRSEAKRGAIEGEGWRLLLRRQLFVREKKAHTPRRSGLVGAMRRGKHD